MTEKKSEETLFDGDALRETFAGLKRMIAEELRVLNERVAALPDAWDRESIRAYANELQAVRRAILGVDVSARNAAVCCSQKLRRYEDEQEARVYGNFRMKACDAVAIMPPKGSDPGRG